MLLLFDVDGTLISAGGAGRKALARAFEEVLGQPGAMEGVRLHGSTDPVIIEDGYARLGRPMGPAEEVARILEVYLERLASELAQVGAAYRVFEGAREVVEAAGATRRHAVGLATGNVERGARLKLEHGGLSEPFSFGGFGSDAADRADLIRHGVRRGRAWAHAELDRDFDGDEVVVIGDTERDIHGARAAGARAVGVLAGAGDPEALLAARPDLVVDSLEDPRLWRYLRL